MLKHFLSLGSLAVLAATPIQVPAQSAPVKPGKYIARLQMLSQHEEKILDACLVVNERGEFRREARIVRAGILANGSPGAKLLEPASEVVDVFEGQLSDEELITFRELLDRPSFRDIPSTEPHGNRHLLRDETLLLSVNRNSGYQRLAFHDKKSRAPYEKDLAPVIKWFRRMQKHPAKKLSDAQPDRCTESTQLP